MNILQKLAKSAEVGHGLELAPVHVKELVTVMQGMQYQIANDQGRLEAQTRILAVALNHVGGKLDIESQLFAEAENYVVNVEWEEEGDVIHASLGLADVAVPEVQDQDEAAPVSAGSAVPVQSGDSGGDEDGEADTDGPTG